MNNLTPPLFERGDFTGSFSDLSFSDSPNLCSENDNLLVNTDRKFISRPGSALNYTAHPQGMEPTRTARFLKFLDDSDIFGASGATLWRDTGSAYASLLGPSPTTNPAFPNGTAAGLLSYGEWRGHLFITNSEGAPPIKIYKDNGSTWQLRTAGLPLPVATYSTAQATVLAAAIVLANDLKAKLAAHYADVTDHGSIGIATHRAADGVSGAGVGANATDLASTLRLTGELVRAYQLHYNDSITGAAYHYRDIPDVDWLVGGTIGVVASPEFLGPQSTDLQKQLISVTVPTTLIGTEALPGAVDLLNDLKTKYNAHIAANESHGSVFNVQNYNACTTGHLYGYSNGPLIDLDRAKIYAVANLIKTRYTAHIAAATAATPFNHSTADSTNTISSANATTPETLEALLWELRLKFTAHDADAEKSSAWSYHRAKESKNHSMVPRADSSYTECFPDYDGGLRAGDWTNLVAMVNAIRAAFNAHAYDTTSHQAATPNYNNPLQAASDDLVLASYNYAFVYWYTYTLSDGTVFEDFSAPLYVGAPDVISTLNEGLAISNIPSLVNGPIGNWDTANIKVKIYRTTDAGQTYYYVDQITNGTTTYTDILADTELQTRDALYTTGGVVENTQPPIAKYIHVVGNKGYYGGITESGQSVPRRILQSVDNDPDSVPGDFSIDIDDDLRGISSARSIPIAFGTHSLYRLEGSFDLQGNGSIQAISLSDTVGLVSEQSIVKHESGVFFAGTDGFYFTDGYSLTKLSKEWNSTYLAIVSSATKASRIAGTYDPQTLRIWWAVQATSTNSDNDACFILDLNFPLDPAPTWTSASNEAHFRPTALLFKSGILYRGDSGGYIFAHGAQTTDPYINTAVAASLWGTKTIRYDFQDTIRSFGSGAVRKWITWININFRRVSNITLQAQARNDDQSAWQSLWKIRFLSTFTWGDPTLIWGTPTYLWNYARYMIGQKRRFPANQVRATYKQVRFTNAYVVIKDSLDTGPATVDNGAKTVTLDTGAKVWLLACEGHFISFAADGYTAQYEILARTSATVLTLSSAPGSGSDSWRISGYPKGEKLHLLDYAIHGVVQSKSQVGARPEVGTDV